MNIRSKINSVLFLLLLCFECSHSTHAASNAFVNYNKSHNLIQNTVTDIVEDRDGFIWFSTFEGLSRFDGYEFKNYTPSKNVKDALPAGFIKKSHIDSQGNLWIATVSGLAKYNTIQDNFTVFDKTNSSLKSNEINTLANDKNGDLLVATNEDLYLFDSQSNSFLPFSINRGKLPNEIKFILSEQDKTWIGSFGNGLFLLEHSSNRLYDLKQNNPWNISLDANYLFDIKKVGHQYWLGTELGAYVVDLTLSQVDLLSPNSLPAIAGQEVRSIIQDGDNRVWLGTSTGISILDENQNLLLTYDDQNNIDFGLKSSHFYRLYADSNNTIWLGTYSGGVYKHTPKANDIKLFSPSSSNPNSLSGKNIWGMKEGSDGKIWIASQTAGINSFSPDTVTFQRYLADFKHHIWSITLDDLEQIWIASSGGLFVYDQNGNSNLTLKKTLFADESILKANFLDGKIWLPTKNNSLSWIDIQNFEIHSIALSNKNISSVNPLFLDSNQNIWFDTNIGILHFNIVTEQITRLILDFANNDTSYVNKVIETENAFWLSSAVHGLITIDKNSYEVIYQLNMENGLSSNQVLSAFIHKNSMWAAHSNGGIDEISLSTHKVLQNIAPEMFDFNELNEGVGLLTSDEHILFGGGNGFLMFDPNQLSVENQLLNMPKNEENKAPSIMQFRVFSLPVTIHSENTPLTAPLHLLNNIDLPYESNMLSFKFAQINPAMPEAVTYRYKLKGLSDKWIETVSESPRYAHFSHLNFGTYELQVQSKTELSSWSPTRTLTINIAPPFWLQKNALVIYGILSILILLYILKQARNRSAIQLSIQENEERLKLTLWSSGDELWDWDIYQGQVFRSNTWGTVDFPQDDIRVNSSYEANIHLNDIPRVQESLDAHLKDKSEHYEVTYRIKTYKGDWLWVLDRGKVVARDSNSQPQRMTGTLKNISHLKVAEEQLKLFKRSIETISDGVFITNTEFKYISVNNSYCKYTGETREQALASYLSFHQYPGAFTEEVKKALKHKGNWIGEVESRRVSGEKYEMELNIDAITDEDGKISHYVGVFSDITTRKSTEKELLKLSNTDPLTELPNRSFFLANHANIVRRNTPHALICLDMDNFKKINDSLGHQTGDMLIKQIANRLQKLAGTSATTYRLGGDEFSVLIDNTTDIHKITHFAQSILDVMSRPFIINKQEFVLGASLGIVFYPEDGISPQELLKNADTAMYFAKNAGGNKYQFFSGEMNQNAVRQLQIENLIRHGLKEDLFTVFYQPKVDIASGKLVSMEALVRYEHPVKGIVSPAQFIPLAEETGQIIDIGEVVLRKACQETKKWVDAGLFTGRVAVNISARQFEIPDLDDRIMNILQQVGLSPLHLECEITEGTLMQNPESALTMMQRLRERGIHLALDDFGTGYSSLAYLKRFPINTLKIDKAFIDDIAKASEDRYMTQSIITIAHNLGLKVVAEGVEHEDQLSILRRFKCEMLQGYLYSKPLNTVRFEALLKENNQLRKIIQNVKA
ncbi:EAL domain-containing protein [Paraglaciecola sp.]|uniref:EAL domain-containing protein n=1 Tax=Paraglaciecola sp. TaxID=1920173 RepID=UPI003EF88501